MVDKHTVLFVFACVINLAFGKGVLFPYGLSEGDTFIPINDDGGSEIIKISTLFPFFDSNHDFLFVNTNGVISFLQAVPQFTPDPFPLDGDRRVIAAFWADIDTNRGGTNSYREVLRGDPANEDLFQMADDIIHDAFIDQGKFVSTWMFVATWDEVGFYGSQALEIVNTLQAVLVTNGRHSFAIYNYGEIMWTTGAASGGNSSTGLGGIPAQVGFNAGDGIRYFNVPGSRTHEIVDIEMTTNVNTKGRWVFRVDSAQVEDSGCNTAGTLVVYPIVGSMLGGETILIQGPCFNDTAEIVCKFSDTEVPGTLLTNTTARCITPTLFVADRIPFTVSIDGGDTYDFEGIYTMLSVDQAVPGGIKRVNSENWFNQDEFTIQWDTDVFADIIDLCDIHLLGYIEDPTTGGIQLDDIKMVAEGIPYNVSELTFQRFDIPAYHIVGVFKLIPNGESSNSVVPALWSDVHSLVWVNGHSIPSAARCDNWYVYERTHLEFLEKTHSCPCTLSQALVDTARFSAHPECDVSANTVGSSCQNRPGAMHCVRANEPTDVGGGQECCYAEDEDILNVIFSTGGGFAHRNHHAGVSPYNHAGKVPYLSHFYNDIVPWEHCCIYSQGIEFYCNHYKEVRPSQTCENYQPPNPGGGSGDPHLLTLDGKSYTFNGLGEYNLVIANNDTFVLQARTSIPSSSQETVYKVTAFSAVAVKFGSSDKVHVEVNERRVLDVWIQLHEQETWTRLDFEAATSWSFNGIFINGRNITEKGVLLVFDQGASVELKATKDIMSILFLGPQTFRNDTMGLLGTWNGDPDDDFRLPDGTVLPPYSTTQELHSFGQSWEVVADSSLFYYPTGLSYEDFRDPTFVPEFEPPDNPKIDNETLWRVCQGNEWCAFDLQATEDEEIAVASKVAYEETVAVINVSKNVIICDALETPDNGAKAVTKSTVGGRATFSCSSGFSLEGNEEIVCLSTGEWSGEPPLCIPIPTTAATSTATATTSIPGQNPDKLSKTMTIVISSSVIAGIVLIPVLVAVISYCVDRAGSSRKRKKSSEEMEMPRYSDYINQGMTSDGNI